METNKNKTIIIILIAVLLLMISYIVYSEITDQNFIRDMFVKEEQKNNNENNNNQNNESNENNNNQNNESNENNNNQNNENNDSTDLTKRYGDLDEILVKSITKDEVNNLIQNSGAKCGVNGIIDEGKQVLCSDMGTDSQISYIENDIAYFAKPKVICVDDECETDENNYNVYKINDKVKDVNVDYTQYESGIVNVATENGDLYYFIITFDITSDTNEEYYNFIKINTDLKFKEFVKNIENNVGATFGTATVVKMSDNNLYIIEYDIDKETVSLVNYNK